MTVTERRQVVCSLGGCVTYRDDNACCLACPHEQRDRRGWQCRNECNRALDGKDFCVWQEVRDG